MRHFSSGQQKRPCTYTRVPVSLLLNSLPQLPNFSLSTDHRRPLVLQAGRIQLLAGRVSRAPARPRFGQRAGTFGLGLGLGLALGWPLALALALALAAGMCVRAPKGWPRRRQAPRRYHTPQARPPLLHGGVVPPHEAEPLRRLLDAQAEAGLGLGDGDGDGDDARSRRWLPWQAQVKGAVEDGLIAFAGHGGGWQCSAAQQR